MIVEGVVGYVTRLVSAPEEAGGILVELFEEDLQMLMAIEPEAVFPAALIVGGQQRPGGIRQVGFVEHKPKTFFALAASFTDYKTTK